MVSSSSSIFISRDEARTWSEWQFRAPIRSLVASDGPWAAALAGQEVYLSADGSVWAHHDRVAGTGEVYGIASSRTRVFFATTTGLRVSDQARAMRLVSGLPEGNTVQAICRDPRRDSALYAASYDSIYASMDAGQTWRKMATDGLPAASIRQLIVARGSPDRLLVLTAQQGVFALPLDHVSGSRGAGGGKVGANEAGGRQIEW
jgi:hypothetical protein